MNTVSTKRYIGISLGPIDRILDYAKSTRAIWASSYLFAYLGKQIAGRYFFEKGNRFLKPWITKEMFDLKDGVGRFPDQYIFETEATVADVRQYCNGVLESLAGNMANVLKSESQADEMANYLKHVLRIIIVERQFPEQTEDQAVVQDLQKRLGAMECRDAYLAEETRNYLAAFFESTSTESALYKDVTVTDKQGRLFSTILECSAGKEGEPYRTELLKENPKLSLKPYQKYIAFVSADGDNFGKTLATLGNVAGSVFMAYNLAIRKLVDDYGGQVIYQGGDDILFFAPVYNEGKDIFHLLKVIDTCFAEILHKNEAVKKHLANLPVERKPTLSYGVSISYYKYPMAEAKDLSGSLLEEVKNVPAGTPKNKIRWRVRKHSGQLFGGTLDKNQPEQYEKSIQLIAGALFGDSNFLHSVTHWLNRQQPALGAILKLEGGGRAVCLDNYVANSFNEPEHQKYTGFFSALKALLLAYPMSEGIDAAHRILRYVDLLIKKEDK